MLRLVVLLSLAALAVSSPTGVLSGVQLSQTAKSSSSAVGFEFGTRALEGVDVCLGTDIRNVVFEGCTRSPCELNVGQLYNVKVDFVALLSHRGLKATISFDNYFNLEPALDVEVPNSAVEAGQMYTLSFNLRPRGQVMGEAVLRVIVYDDTHSEYQWEVCFNTFLNIV